MKQILYLVRTRSMEAHPTRLSAVVACKTKMDLTYSPCSASQFGRPMRNCIGAGSANLFFIKRKWGQPPNPRVAFRRSPPIAVGGLSKYSCADEKTFRDTSFEAYHDVLITYFGVEKASRRLTDRPDPTRNP